MIIFMYLLVGNYGVNWDDYEFIVLICKGVIVKEYVWVVLNWC